jgi:hypothetical protein
VIIGRELREVKGDGKKKKVRPSADKRDGNKSENAVAQDGRERVDQLVERSTARHDWAYRGRRGIEGLYRAE